MIFGAKKLGLLLLTLRSGAAKLRQSRCVRPPESSSSSSTHFPARLMCIETGFVFVYLISNTLWEKTKDKRQKTKYKIQIQNTDCTKKCQKSTILKKSDLWIFRDFQLFLSNFNANLNFCFSTFLNFFSHHRYHIMTEDIFGHITLALKIVKMKVKNGQNRYSWRPKNPTFPKLAQNNVKFFLLPSTTRYQCVLPWKKNSKKLKNKNLNWHWSCSKKVENPEKSKNHFFLRW